MLLIAGVVFLTYTASLSTDYFWQIKWTVACCSGKCTVPINFQVETKIISLIYLHRGTCTGETCTGDPQSTSPRQYNEANFRLQQRPHCWLIRITELHAFRYSIYSVPQAQHSSGRAQQRNNASPINMTGKGHSYFCNLVLCLRFYHKWDIILC